MESLLYFLVPLIIAGVLIFVKKQNSRKLKDFYNYKVDKVYPDQLRLCKEGDYVTVWVPDDRHVAILYRVGTHTGDGRVGDIKGDFLKKIVAHIDRGDKINASFLSIGMNTCTIHIEITSSETILSERTDHVEITRRELDKKYNPKKPFYYDWYLRGEFAFKEGDFLDIDLKGPFHDLLMLKIPVRFNKLHIGEITSQTVAKKLIRANRTGHNITSRIVEIKHLDNSQQMIKIEFVASTS